MVLSRSIYPSLSQRNHDELGIPSPAVSMVALNVLLSFAFPWKSRHRTTFVSLVALILLSAFIFLVTYPSLALAPLALRRPVDANSPSRIAILGASRRWKVTPDMIPLQEELQLSPEQELAAVSSFLASLPQNIIPLSVDPHKPIDPQVVLDFDSRSPRASNEVQAMVEEVWARNPVVLYSKFYSPVSREIKAILAGMNLHPAPTIFDVDMRDDFPVLMPLLKRITDRTDFPILLVGGKPVGPLEHIRALKESGQLKAMITTSGAVINGAKRRKGRK